jgi:hypothetical protein
MDEKMMEKLNATPEVFTQEVKEQTSGQTPQDSGVSAPTSQTKKETKKEKEKEKEIKPVGEKPQNEQSLAPIKDPMPMIFELAKELTKSGAVEALKELFTLRQEITQEIAKKEFFENLRRVQEEIPPIERKRVVRNRDGSLRYRYATYEDILRAVKPVLTKYGFSFSFKSRVADKQLTVWCELTHEGGHTESTEVTLPILETGNSMNPVQGIGALLSYAKRYSLSLLLGLGTEEDIDGNVMENIEIIKDNTIIIHDNPTPKSFPDRRVNSQENSTATPQVNSTVNPPLVNSMAEIEDAEYVERRKLRIEAAQLIKDYLPNKRTHEREEFWQNFLMRNFGVTTSKALTIQDFRRAVELLKKELHPSNTTEEDENLPF